jgi:hypothetical protein
MGFNADRPGIAAWISIFLRDTLRHPPVAGLAGGRLSLPRHLLLRPGLPLLAVMGEDAASPSGNVPATLWRRCYGRTTAGGSTIAKRNSGEVVAWSLRSQSGTCAGEAAAY